MTYFSFLTYIQDNTKNAGKLRSPTFKALDCPQRKMKEMPAPKNSTSINFNSSL
jgi:hypothetical protein